MADNGYELYQEGSYDEAIAAFRLSYELSGSPVLLYNASLAYERQGKFDEAIAYIQAYRVFATPEEREKLAEKVESFKRRKLNAEFEEHEQDASAAEEPPPSGEGMIDTTDASSDRAPGEKPLFGPVAIAETAIAGAGFAAALGLGLAASNKNSAAEEACADGICADGTQGDLNAARRLALGADIALGIGAAGALALVVTLAVNGSRRAKLRKEQQAHAFVVPHRGGAGLGWRF